MKNKILNTLILLLFLTTTYAQEIDFKWGKTDKISKTTASPEILGVREGKTYILKSEKPKDLGTYYISAIELDDLNSEKKIELGKILPKDVASNNIYAAYLIKDNIIVVSTTKNKELIGSILDLNGKVIKGKINIDRADAKDKEFDGFSVELSPDESVILGYRKTKGKDKKSTGFVFSTFNPELKRLNSAKVELPYDEDNIDIGKVRIDNSSNVYIVANLTIEGKRKKFDVIKSVLLHLPMDKQKPELNEVALPLEKRLATSMSFLVLNDKIVITGMYASNADAEFLEGVFYTELSKGSLEVINSSYQKFKPGLQTRKAASNKFENKPGFGYKLQEIILEDSKEKVLIFENRYETYSTDNQGNVSKNTYALDFIVVKLDAENKIEWNTMIYKNQALRVPYSSVVGIGPLAISTNVYRYFRKFESVVGYCSIYKNGKLYLVFNDHNDNMKSKNAEEVYNNSKKSYSAMITLDAKTGKWEKKPLFKSKESQRILAPDNSMVISENKILLFSFEKKGMPVGIFSIE